MLKTPLSDIRKRYTARLVVRCLILIFAVIVYLTDFEKHDILQGFDFFHKFSWMHILWILWVLDMLQQLIPVKNIALGSLHDVHAYALCEGILLPVAAGYGCSDLTHLGAVCAALSGAVLGKIQYPTEMLGMYR